MKVIAELILFLIFLLIIGIALLLFIFRKKLDYPNKRKIKKARKPNEDKVNNLLRDSFKLGAKRRLKNQNYIPVRQS